LNDKIEEAKRKKNVLIARKKRAEAQRAIQDTMSGLRDQSAFETFDRMAAKVDQIEAEAEAEGDLAEEYSGDTLTSKFKELEGKHSSDEDLVALKRKMGMLPAEEEKAPAPPVQARVEAPAVATAGAGKSDQDELAAALEELEAEQQGGEKRKAGR
jgi:phage shock protein A